MLSYLPSMLAFHIYISSEDHAEFTFMPLQCVIRIHAWSLEGKMNTLFENNVVVQMILKFRFS